MFQIDIPGFKTLALQNIVLDFNGTISCDGKLLAGVSERLAELNENFTIHVITADTFGSVREQVSHIANIIVLETDDHRAEKGHFVSQLGEDGVMAFGNGRNDVQMLEAAAVGIAVCQGEGAAAEVIQHADVVVNDILNGLDLLRFPKRLMATLRA